MINQAFIPPSPFLGNKPAQRRSTCRTALRASVAPDVVVIGAGVAGLSTAYELAQKGASVKVISSPARKPAALASAGMLAPGAENLSGDMNTLSRVSREMYPDYVRRLQQLVDVDVQYVSRNDFLIPSFTPLSGPTVLSGDALRSVEPTLGPKVKAARRSSGDASIDSRRLMSALYKACVALGVKFEEDIVSSVVVAPDGQTLEAVLTKTSRVIGGHYLVASGAWTASLLPQIPISPVKGQILSLSPPDNGSPRLNHVLFGHDVYIVPKNGGNEFYVGATVERAGFDTKVTARGINQLLSKAMELVPTFAEYEINEMWAGLRPATPDLLPVIGQTEYQNVTITSGFYRNGILLAPATSALAAAFVLHEVNRLPQHLQELAPRFSYERLLHPGVSTGGQGDEHEQLVQSTYSRLQEQHTGPVPSEPEASTEIKVWKVNKDGTKEPVIPSERYQQVHAKRVRPPTVSYTSKIDLNASVLRKREKESQSSEPIDGGVYQGGEGFSSREEDLKQVSGENDAYEDVMRKRANADEVMSRAMAANRSFGRKKSSLEADGSVPLSISEEEVAAFDAALNQGIEDMKKLEKHFDPNDPSVRRTQAEKEMSIIENTEGGVRINGVVVPSFGRGSSSPGSEPTGYY